MFIERLHTKNAYPLSSFPDRELTERDVVVWYTFGQTHIPRLEDWPGMRQARFILSHVNNMIISVKRSTRGRAAAPGRDDSDQRY
jgi:hypothetical protein